MTINLFLILLSQNCPMFCFSLFSTEQRGVKILRFHLYRAMPCAIIYRSFRALKSFLLSTFLLITSYLILFIFCCEKNDSFSSMLNFISLKIKIVLCPSSSAGIISKRVGIIRSSIFLTSVRISVFTK